MHIESWFCTRTRMLDCLVCLINSWISYLNQFFIWSSFNLDIPFLGFLSLLVLGKVMWETKPLLEYFVSKRRRATSHWLEFQQNTFNQVLVIKYKDDQKVTKKILLKRQNISNHNINQYYCEEEKDTVTECVCAHCTSVNHSLARLSNCRNILCEGPLLKQTDACTSKEQLPVGLKNEIFFLAF